MIDHVETGVITKKYFRITMPRNLQNISEYNV
jgi:hypothetical protein